VSREREACVIVRLLLAVAALAVAALAVQRALVRQARHREVLRLVAETGLALRQPDVARAAEADPDPVRGRLAVARALLAEASDYRSFSKLPPRERAEAAARVNERLELAHGIAGEVLSVRPGDWQAAMILGGTTYRLWSSRGDPRVFTDRAVWEEPLVAATRLALGEDEPWRLLAVAQLEVWPALTPAERDRALVTLRRAFEDPATFARCAEMWLSVAGDRAEAFALVPDDSTAWSVLEGLYAARAEWDAWCAARLRRDGALERELRQRVAEARDRLRGGDPAGARSLAVAVVASAPVDSRFAATVQDALAVCPPGPVASRETARRWLAWAAEGFVRGRERLSAGAVARLVASAGALPPQEAALVALMAGDLTDAESVERRNDAPGTEAWAPYWIAKARALAGQGRSADATAALARVQRDARASLPGVEAHLVVARAAADHAEAAAVEVTLRSLAATSWPATAWRWRGQAAHLDLLAGSDASGVTLGFDVVPPRGAAVRVGVDGETLAIAPVQAGGELSIAEPLGRGAHLLEVEPLAGGGVAPGKVQLTPQAR
jgi:hypothetical protein